MTEHERAAGSLGELAEFAEGLKSLLSVEKAKVQFLQKQLDQATEGSNEELEATRARLDDSLRELEAMRNTKVFRYSSGLRQAYSRARRGQRAGSRLMAGDTSPAPEEPPPASYVDWISRYRPSDARSRHLMQQSLSRFDDSPLISLIMPVFNPSEITYEPPIESVRAQWYQHWQLCIADDVSTEEWVPGILSEYEALDTRISVVRHTENRHIAAASNSALDMATGSFVGFLDHDDALAEEALSVVALAIRESPGVGLLYSDEDKIDVDDVRSDPYFKPSWDPLLLLGQNYLTHFLVVRRDILMAVGGLRIGFEGAQDWDLAFRLTEGLDSEQIVHIPHILYHWRLHPRSTSLSQAAKPYAAEAAFGLRKSIWPGLASWAMSAPLGASATREFTGTCRKRLPKSAL